MRRSTVLLNLALIPCRVGQVMFLVNVIYPPNPYYHKLVIIGSLLIAVTLLIASIAYRIEKVRDFYEDGATTAQ